MSTANHFASSWDGLVKGVTIGLFALTALFTAVLIIISDNPVLRVVIIIVFSCLLFIPYLGAPRGYTVHDRLINVKRLIGDARIPIVGEAERWKWT